MKNLFEKELKNKLALKSSSHTTEETVLLKAFKYFDLDNSGNCSKDEFLKAITKIGITGFSEENLLELFDVYDVDGSGELDYKEFVGGLFNFARELEHGVKAAPAGKGDIFDGADDDEECIGIEEVQLFC